MIGPLEALTAEPVLALGVGGSIGLLLSSFALGLRHGVDWDHIAAIVDITSSSGTAARRDDWLTKEPGLMLTDESHHAFASVAAEAAELENERVVVGETATSTVSAGSGVMAMTMPHPPRWAVFLEEQRQPLLLGTMYAVGHATMVLLLGLLAILAGEFLPAWLDPIMGRIVGATLLFLAAYLFYSLYRYFTSGSEFRLRSRWMLVFAAVRNVWSRATSWFRGHEHRHVEPGEQYGGRTAYTIGLVHGIGAETGTQVLLIATAVGAGTKATGVAALLMFVLGLLISNSVVTVTSSAGFVSAQRRRMLYVAAGLLAAVFSLVLGLIFLFEAGSVLPALDPVTRWIGGPDV